jgi:beta-barrel assembly-enhancing protease
MPPRCCSRRARRRDRLRLRSAGLLAACAAWLLLGGAGACGTLSLAEERELGAEVAADVERQMTLVTDSVVRGYVEQLGRRIVAAAGPQPLTYQFHVVDNEDLNAFAVPGGHVYMNTGTILAARDMGEVAGVMAHEIGHVALRHTAQSYNRQRNTGLLYQIGTAALGALYGDAGATGGQVLGGLAAQAYLTSYSREAEAEADLFAVEVLPRAGIDPQGLVDFFETLRRDGGGSSPLQFLSSHPTTDERIAGTQAAIRRASLPAGLRRTDSQLDVVKRRIRALHGG